MQKELLVRHEDVDPVKLAELAEHMQNCQLCQPCNQVNDWCASGCVLFLAVIATATERHREMTQKNRESN
jgi:hypothetical protein